MLEFKCSYNVPNLRKAKREERHNRRGDRDCRHFRYRSSSASQRDGIYTYDARGRVIKVERSGTINNSVVANYTLDRAENRTNVKVTGAP